jgi:hypothetical protein
MSPMDSDQRGQRASSDYHKAASRHGPGQVSGQVGSVRWSGGLWPFVLANGSGPSGPPWTHWGSGLRPFGARVCARVGQQKKKKGPE